MYRGGFHLVNKSHITHGEDMAGQRTRHAEFRLPSTICSPSGSALAALVSEPVGSGLAGQVLVWTAKLQLWERPEVKWK